MTRTATQHPDYSGLCVLPDGTVETVAKAKEDGYHITNGKPSSASSSPVAAYPHPIDGARVVLASGGTVPRTSALRDGLRILPNRQAAEQFARHLHIAQQEHPSYAKSILALPEARERPAAAALIASSYGPTSMPLARASAFLAGLPLETNAAQVPQSSAADERRFKRTCELKLLGFQLNTAFNADAKQKGAKLAYALQVHEQSGTPLLSAIRASGLTLNELNLDGSTV